MRIFSSILRALLPALALLAAQFVHAQAVAPGALDSSFGTNGARVLTLGPNGGEFRAVVKQPDGKLVATGWLRNATGGYGAAIVARFTPTGDLDTGFAGTGVLTIAPSGVLSGIVPYGIALTPDGKIVIGSEGFTTSSGGAYVITRISAAGVVDSGFGFEGSYLQSRSGGVPNGVRALAVQSDGQIIVAGFVTKSDGKWAMDMFRIKANGSESDATFSTGGSFYLSVNGGNVVPSAIAMRADNSFVVAGWIQYVAPNGTTFQQYLTSFTANGSEGGASNTTDLNTSANDQFEAVAFDASGRILTAGYGLVGGNSVAVARRLSTSGSQDATFTNGTIPGYAGVALVGSNHNEGYGKGIHALSNGDVLMTGHVRGGSADETWFTARMSGSGAIPSGGYPTAVYEIKPNNQYGRVRASTLTHDGSVALVGYLNDPVSGKSYPAIAKVAVNGMFGTDLEVVEYYSPTLVKYFMTARLTEKKLLDQPNGSALARTGVTFKAYSPSAGQGTPVTRFFAYKSGEFSTHFYLTIASEIATIGAQSWATNEGIDMYFTVPDVFTIVGRGQVRVCPANTKNIWRVFKQKANPAAAVTDPNHRYVDTEAALAEMVSRGYTDEGIVFCGRL